MKRLISILMSGLVLTAVAVSAQAHFVSSNASAQARLSASSSTSVEIQKAKDELKALRKKQNEEKRLYNMTKPKTFMAKVDSTDAAKNLILLKQKGRYGSVAVTSKTVLTAITADGPAPAVLADFKTDDRVWVMVRRDLQSDTSVTGLVVVKLPAQPKEDNEDDDAPPPANSGTQQ